MRHITLGATAGCLVFGAIANDVQAQSYPSRPLRLIVASAPGGSPDINAREMASELVKSMGQQVVVEADPLCVDTRGVLLGFEAVTMNALLFQRPDDPFDHGASNTLQGIAFSPE